MEKGPSDPSHGSHFAASVLRTPRRRLSRGDFTFTFKTRRVCAPLGKAGVGGFGCFLDTAGIFGLNARVFLTTEGAATGVGAGGAIDT